jgi:hypothetical protein
LENKIVNKKSLISVGGGAAILFGCFLPVMHVPLLGSISYMVADGKLVAILGGLIILFALFKRLGFAAIAAIGVALMAGYDFCNMLAKFSNPDTDNAIAKAFVQAVSPGEAWAVIALGVVAVIAALFVPEPASQEVANSGWYKGSLKD